MNKNQENYKKAIEELKPSEELKQNTFKKATIKKEIKKPVIMKYIAACAVFAICFSLGALYLNGKKPKTITKPKDKEQVVAQVENDLPRFKDMEEFRKAVKENSQSIDYFDGDMILEDASTSINSPTQETKQEKSDYSETNTQVEGVDEADIVKTDGNYIYYINNSKIYIIEAKTLKIKSTIEYKKENKITFYPSESYIKDEKLIILGNGYETSIDQTSTEKEDVVYDYILDTSKNVTKATVYDISDKENPKLEREVSVDGTYDTSRMIDNNIYFISSKRMYTTYLEDLNDDEILPIIKDTTNEDRQIKCTEIAYFEGTNSNELMIVASFNINNKESVKTENFFGASDTVYSSKENLYITQSQYSYTFGIEKTKSTIYKFNLKDANIILKAQTEINGLLNDQFSMDEYEENLRIATTSGYGEKATNQLYILDEKLNEIGKIENLAEGEEIHSVRFTGKTGYIVTFQEIDPLFVIDLSDPKKPEVKGELKIPGYSAYLHPYDETHIIGIGYNVKSNGYGGVTNNNMKMSMFDISDMQNPKEIFNIDIGTGYTSSEITSNHKALFYNQSKNLIGFPVKYREDDETYKQSSKFEIYEINLEKGFTKYGTLKNSKNDTSYETIKRAIYIDSKLYTLSSQNVKSYNLETLEQEKELELE